MFYLFNSKVGLLLKLNVLLVAVGQLNSLWEILQITLLKKQERELTRQINVHLASSLQSNFPWIGNHFIGSGAASVNWLI